MNTTVLNEKGKVRWLVKIGYGIGQMSDSIPFNLFYFFFLYFLTDVAGIRPAVAGTISLIAVFWDAITDPIIGYLSDNNRSRFGRRRTFMIASAIPYFICVWLLFTSVNFGEPFVNVYYIILAMVFWTFYTAFVIPYFALGAEITQDFQERTSLRAVAGVFMMGAVTIASALPLLIVGKVMDYGGTAQKGWSVVGLIMGLLTLITVVICWRLTRGTETPLSEDDKGKGENFFITFGKMLKLKPTLLLIFSVLLFAGTCAMGTGGLVYLMTYNLGMDETTQALVFTILTVVGMAWMPVADLMARRIGKKNTYILNVLITGVGITLFKLVGFSGFGSMMVWTVIFVIGNSTFWSIGYSMMYDISELYEFKYGVRREGTITSLTAFFQKLGSASVMWLTGMVLSYVGYVANAASQTPQALNGIELIVTVLPGIMAIISGILIIFYPLTQKRYEALFEALSAKKAGREYSIGEIEKLL